MADKKTKPRPKAETGAPDAQDKLIDAAEETVARAESYGMDLTKARLELTRARDHLIRARVTVHAFDPVQMMAEVQGTPENPGGLIYVQRAEALAEAAFGDRTFRRKGMAFTLLIIASLMVALVMKIRRMESPGSSPSGSRVPCK